MLARFQVWSSTQAAENLAECKHVKLHANENGLPVVHGSELMHMSCVWQLWAIAYNH